MQTDRLIAALERRIEHLERQLGSSGALAARPAVDVALRLATVVDATPVGNATAQDKVRVWTIRFVDTEFTETIGGQTATPEERAARDSQAAAQGDAEFAEDDLVLVARVQARWWIVQRFSPWELRIVKTTTAHGKGETEDCDLYEGTKGSETATGNAIACYNRFADLDENAWALAAHLPNGWELIAAECRVTTTTTSTTSTTTTSTTTTSTTSTTTSTTTTTTSTTSSTTTSSTTTSTTTTSTTTSSTTTSTTTSSTTTTAACSNYQCTVQWNAGMGQWTVITTCQDNGAQPVCTCPWQTEGAGTMDGEIRNLTCCTSGVC